MAKREQARRIWDSKMRKQNVLRKIEPSSSRNTLQVRKKLDWTKYYLAQTSKTVCWSWGDETDKFAVVGCWESQWIFCAEEHVHPGPFALALEASFLQNQSRSNRGWILNISLQKLPLKACMRTSLQCQSMSLLLRSLELVTHQRNLRLFSRDSTSQDFSQTCLLWLFSPGLGGFGLLHCVRADPINGLCIYCGMPILSYPSLSFCIAILPQNAWKVCIQKIDCKKYSVSCYALMLVSD